MSDHILSINGRARAVPERNHWIRVDIEIEHGQLKKETWKFFESLFLIRWRLLEFWWKGVERVNRVKVS